MGLYTQPQGIQGKGFQGYLLMLSYLSKYILEYSPTNLDC